MTFQVPNALGKIVITNPIRNQMNYFTILKLFMYLVKSAKNRLAKRTLFPRTQ